MRRYEQLALAIALAVVPTAPAHGQRSQAIPLIGERVRITHCADAVLRSAPGRRACERVVGVLLAVDRQAVRIRVSPESEVALDRAGVQRFERSRGARRRTGRGALIGGAVGLGLGLGLAAMVAGSGSDDDIGAFVLGVPVAGAAAGTVVGAGVGAMVVTERWTDVPVEVFAFAPGGGGRVGVGARVSF